MNRRALERGLSSQGAKVDGTGNNIGVADTRTNEIAALGGVGNASARRQRRPPRVLFSVSEPERMHKWGEYGEETLVASILREKNAGQGQQHDGSGDGRGGDAGGVKRGTTGGGGGGGRSRDGPDKSSGGDNDDSGADGDTAAVSALERLVAGAAAGAKENAEVRERLSS
jgi:hypothetical protein